MRILGEQMGRVELARLRHSIGHVNPRHRLQYPLTVREVVLTGITATIDTRCAGNRLRSTQFPPRGRHAAYRNGGPVPQSGLTSGPPCLTASAAALCIALAFIPFRNLGCCCSTNPTTGLDVAAREQLPEVIDTLDETHPRRRTILVTHQLQEPPTTMMYSRCSSRRAAPSPPGLPVQTVTIDNVTVRLRAPR